MARAVETCVHCGFCLPSCPTYRVLGEEMDSPRGPHRSHEAGARGRAAARDVLPYIDRCLGCLGCETSCPSGVRYRDLLIPFRAKAEVEARSPALKWRARAGASVAGIAWPVSNRRAERAARTPCSAICCRRLSARCSASFPRRWSRPARCRPSVHGVGRAPRAGRAAERLRAAGAVA